MALYCYFIILFHPDEIIIDIIVICNMTDYENGKDTELHRL